MDRFVKEIKLLVFFGEWKNGDNDFFFKKDIVMKPTHMCIGIRFYNMDYKYNTALNPN